MFKLTRPSSVDLDENQDRFVRLGTTVKAKLGKGGYGQVVPAHVYRDDRVVAMKHQPVESDDATREVALFLKMQDKKSDNLVELIRMFVDKSANTLA